MLSHWLKGARTTSNPRNFIECMVQHQNPRYSVGQTHACVKTAPRPWLRSVKMVPSHWSPATLHPALPFRPSASSSQKKRGRRVATGQVGDFEPVH